MLLQEFFNLRVKFVMLRQCACKGFNEIRY
ncbi:hypothetical protein CBM2595_A80079 [Cupriavidus taiwanensis]|nr:hypothetical protein CBM2595_A80079 [Cupriavidus taiwanensis]